MDTNQLALVTNLVRTCKGIGTPQRALDAVKAGVMVENHWQIWCTERFHMDGSRCEKPEDISNMWPVQLARPTTDGALHDLLHHYTGSALTEFYVGHDACPLWHVELPKFKMEFLNRVVTEGLNVLLSNTFNTIPASVSWFVALIGAGTGTVTTTAANATLTGSGTAFANGDNGDSLIVVGVNTASADLITTVSGNPASATSLTMANNAILALAGTTYALEPRAADTAASHAGYNEAVPYSNGTRQPWTPNGAAAAGADSNSSSKASFTINAPSRIFGAIMISNSTKSGTTGSLYGGDLDITNGSRSVVSGDTLNVQVDLSAVTQ